MPVHAHPPYKLRPGAVIRGAAVPSSGPCLPVAWLEAHVLAKHALASLPLLPAPRYARKHFPSTRYLDYAITVENYTLQKVCVRGRGAWWVGGWGPGRGAHHVLLPTALPVCCLLGS